MAIRQPAVTRALTAAVLLAVVLLFLGSSSVARASDLTAAAEEARYESDMSGRDERASWAAAMLLKNKKPTIDRGATRVVTADDEVGPGQEYTVDDGVDKSNLITPEETIVLYDKLQHLGAAKGTVEERMRRLLRQAFAIHNNRGAKRLMEKSMGLREVGGVLEAKEKLRGFLFYMLQTLLGPASPISRSLYLSDEDSNSAAVRREAERPADQPHAKAPPMTRITTASTPPLDTFAKAYILFINVQVIKGAVVSLRKLTSTIQNSQQAIGRLMQDERVVEAAKLSPQDRAKIQSFLSEAATTKNEEIMILLVSIYDNLMDITRKLSRCMVTKPDEATKLLKEAIPFMNTGAMGEVVLNMQELEGKINPNSRCGPLGMGGCLDEVGCRWDWCASALPGSGLDSGRCVPKNYYTPDKSCCATLDMGSGKKLGVEAMLGLVNMDRQLEGVRTEDKPNEFLRHLCGLQGMCVMFEDRCLDLWAMDQRREAMGVRDGSTGMPDVVGTFSALADWFNTGSALHLALSEAVQSTVGKGQVKKVTDLYLHVVKSIEDVDKAATTLLATQASAPLHGEVRRALDKARLIADRLSKENHVTSWEMYLPVHYPASEIVAQVTRTGRLLGLIGGQIMAQQCVVEERGYC